MFLLLMFKRQINPFPLTPSADLLLPKMEAVMAPNNISQPENCHNSEPFRAMNTQRLTKHVEKCLVDSISPDTQLLGLSEYNLFDSHSQ